jgi:hypothetical protein
MVSDTVTGFAWWQLGVVYQIYPRSFQDSNGDGIGDLPGITARLDDLVDLGIDALWISPIFASPMADFGYDVSDHCDIYPPFGTLADFDRLTAAAAVAFRAFVFQAPRIPKFLDNRFDHIRRDLNLRLQLGGRHGSAHLST